MHFLYAWFLWQAWWDCAIDLRGQDAGGVCLLRGGENSKYILCGDYMLKALQAG